MVYSHIQCHEATLQIVIIPYLNFTPQKKGSRLGFIHPRLPLATRNDVSIFLGVCWNLQKNSRCLTAFLEMKMFRKSIQ